MQQEISIEGLRQEVSENPTDVRSHLRLGWALYGKDAYAEAVQTLSEAQERFPEEIEVIYALALAKKQHGQKESALELFREVVKRSSEIKDEERAMMLRRIALGHANQLEHGTWELELWERR